jgi:WD40 repeat protein
LEITHWNTIHSSEGSYTSNYIGTAIAISPDSKMMAVAYTREQRKTFAVTEQAEVILYDLNTGAIIAKAAHPPLKQKRDDPFAARINKLLFTPDGKYLLSSTNDTLLWEIVNKS